MILTVIEYDHDHEPEIYEIDTDKLNPENPVDAAIIETLKGKPPESRSYYCRVDAKGWDDKNSPFKGHEPEISHDAKVDSDKKELILKIDFDC